MTKSFLIALTGFAIGLGVTTAITFIVPELAHTGAPSPLTLAPDMANAPTARVELRLPARLPVPPSPTKPPVVKKQLALTPKPAATTRRAPPSPTPFSGPPMRAVKQPGIDAVPLAPALASGGDGDTAAHSDRFVDSAEARRREQLEHDNVQLAALIPAPVLPPAPPARLAAPPKRDGGAGAAGQGDEGGDEDGEGGGTAARGASKPLIGVRPPRLATFRGPHSSPNSGHGRHGGLGRQGGTRRPGAGRHCA